MAASNGGGMATTRLTAKPEAMAERLSDAEYARDYLIRKGHGDLLEVLGLDGHDSGPCCQAPGCGKPFLPTATGGKQRTCGHSCAKRLTAAERQADRNERNAKAKGNV